MPTNVNASQQSLIIRAPSTESPSAPSRADAEVSQLAAAAQQIRAEQKAVVMTADELDELSKSLIREETRLLKEGHRLSESEVRRINANISDIKGKIANAVLL